MTRKIARKVKALDAKVPSAPVVLSEIETGYVKMAFDKFAARRAELDQAIARNEENLRVLLDPLRAKFGWARETQYDFKLNDEGRFVVTPTPEA